jgi:hypothetical protein
VHLGDELLHHILHTITVACQRRFQVVNVP